MPTKTSAIVLAAAISLILPSATFGQYVLRHPGREHCRPHYVKKLERIKGRKETVCVSAAPARATTFVVISDEWAGELGSRHTSVQGDIKVLEGHDLIGTPIDFKITNEATGQLLGAFTEPSDPPKPCALTLRVEGDTQTIAGEAAPPEEACPISVSLPTGQLAVLTGSFAGNSSYAPSVSEGKGL